MITPELQKAIDCLQIHDVYLRELTSNFSEGVDPKYGTDFSEFIVESKNGATASEIFELDEDGLSKILRVYIVAGARWVERSDEKRRVGESQETDNDMCVKAIIEAEFIAEYIIKETLDQDCIDEFANKNAIYHVWPYWRELLASQCARMRIPPLTAPMMQLSHSRQDQESDPPSRD